MKLSNFFLGSLFVLVLVFSGCSDSGSSSVDTASTLDVEDTLVSNTSPVAQATSLSTNREITISSTFDVTDAEDSHFTYEILTHPQNGTLVVEDTYNIFTYTPDFGYIGSDYFTYRAYDGKSYSNEVNVTIDITELTLVSQTDTALPSNPVVISISSPSSNSITLFWSASSDADTSLDDMIYEIHMSLDGNFTTSESTKKLSVKGTQEATILDLDESTRYYVKVRAVDLGANSALSNEVSIETSASNSVVLNSSNVIKTASSLFLNNTTVEDSNISFISDDKAIAPEEGDILVGTAEDTYLRKVTSVNTNGNEVVLETEQVAMNEVFDELTLQSKTMLYDPTQLTTTTQAISRYKSYSYNAQTTQGYSWKSGKFAIEKTIPSSSNLTGANMAPINQEGSYVIVSSASEDEIIVTSGELLRVKLLAELNNLSSTNFDENDVSRVLQSFELVSVEHDGKTSSDNFGFSMNTTTLSLDKKEGTVTFIATDAHASVEPYILTLRAKAKWYDTSFIDTWEEDSEEIEIKVSVASKDVEATEGFRVSVEDDGTSTTYTLPLVGTLPPVKNEVEKSYSLKASAGIDVDFVPTLETKLKLKEKLFYAVAGGKMTLTIDSSFESSAAMTNSYEFNLDAINKKFIRIYSIGIVPVYQEVEILWKLVLTPSIEGSVNASNTFTQVFDVDFGVDCNADGCTPVSDNNASSTYTATVDIGAKSSLEIRLIPEIRISFYKAASTGITLEPWAKGSLQASGSAEYASDFTNYDMWSSYSLDTLDATIGIESKVFADLTVFDISWLHYPKDAEYETIYSSEPLTIFSLPTMGIEQPDVNLLIQNQDITLNALTQNGEKTHIVDDTIEWYVYPSYGAAISASDSPLNASVNFSEFGIYKVYFVANSNILTSAFGRQSVEIEIDMRDDDGDSMADRWEEANGLNSIINDASLDKDGDGYTNLFEYQNGTNPDDVTSYPSAPSDVVIEPVNTAPTATLQIITVQQDSSNNTIFLNGSDADGDTLTYTIVTNPTNGTLSGTVPNLTYTPTSGYSGADSFTFKVNDGTVDSNEATVSITVNPPANQLPVANAGEDQSVIEGDDVTFNGSDSSDDGTIVSYVWSEGTTQLSTTMSFTKTDFAVGTHTITLTVTDNQGAAATDEVVVTVNTPANLAPTASSQTITVEQDSSNNTITLSGSDADGDTLTYSYTNPTNGTLNGTAPNLTYTPASGYSGTDSFTFKVNDGTVDSATVTVSITVNAVETPPVVVKVTNLSPLTATQNEAITFTITGENLPDTIAMSLQGSMENSCYIVSTSSTSAQVNCVPNDTGLKSLYVAMEVGGSAIVSDIDLVVTVEANTIVSTPADFTNSCYDSPINPFDQWADDWYECTRYAFGRSCETTGEQLTFNIDADRDGGKWYDIVDASYQRGSEVKANSIAVWSSVKYPSGHVAFVESVDGENITISESNWDALDTEAKYNGQKVLTITEMQTRGINEDFTLVGYVYLTKYPTITLSSVVALQVGEEFSFEANLSNTLDTQYSVKISLGDGGGGYLLPTLMNANANSDTFSYSVAIGTAGERVYRVAIFSGDTQLSSWVDGTYVVNPTVPTLSTSTIKKTGQTLSYDTDGAEVTDGSLKDDGYYQTGQTPRYTRASDIVTDELTNLMWQDDAAVATMTKPWVTQVNYDAGNYNNTSGDTATTYCADLILGGYSDWRFPTVKELQTIVDDSKSSPAIDATFQNIIFNSYWSSTTDASRTSTAWYVNFSDGYTSYYYKSYYRYVRCVRLGQ